MGEEGTTNTGMGFSGGGAEGSGNTSATTETTSAGAAAATETSTNESSVTSGGGGAIPPNTAAAKEADSTIAQSEKGSFVLRYNERTGRNEVVSTMPTEKEEQAEEAPAPQQQEAQPTTQPQEQQPAQPPQENTYNGNEMLQFAQMIRQQPATPMYPPAQPLPVQPQTQPQAAPAQQTEPQDETALAKEYYSNVNKMAKERAMKEIGITQDELDVAEYSDDAELVEKAAAYRAAVENNRTQIMHDVDSIRRAQEAERNDHAQAYQTVVAFTQEMKQKEPNFDAIDKLMISRVNNMPYAEAIKIAPLIQKVQNGTLTTADLPALQEMYNQTRLEFYSKKTGVGLAPKVVNKPAFVEKPGNGAEVPKQTTPLSELGKMSKRDREAAIGQMFSNFFDD